MKPSETRKSALRPVSPERPRHTLSSVSSVSRELWTASARTSRALLLASAVRRGRSPGRGRRLHDLLHRRVEGHRVPGLDQLGLVLADVGDVVPVGVPALRGEPRERLRRTARSEVNSCDSGEAPLVVTSATWSSGRRSSSRKRSRALRARTRLVELHVDVVDHEHDVARGKEVLRLLFRRRGGLGSRGRGSRRGGHRRRGGGRRLGPRERVELHDRLRLAVLEHDEVLAAQARPRVPALLPPRPRAAPPRRRWGRRGRASVLPAPGRATAPRRRGRRLARAATSWRRGQP